MVQFETGSKYTNRLQSYTVKAVNGDFMSVEYDDGSLATLSIPIQSRVIDNMVREETHPSSTKRPTQKTEGYYFTLGFIASRLQALHAFVPHHAVYDFQDDYANATGQELAKNQPGVTLHPEDTNKWWTELRISLIATRTELHLLTLGRGIQPVLGTPDDEHHWNINSKPLVLDMLALGFRFGPSQDRAQILGIVPDPFKGSFRAGLKRGDGK